MADNKKIEQLEMDLRNSLNDINYNIGLHHKGIHAAEFLMDCMANDRPYEDS